MLLLSEYFSSLTKDEQEDFAGRIGTTTRYIKYHLLADKTRDKRFISEPMAHAIVRESGGVVGYVGVMAEFFPQIIEEVGCGETDRRPRPIGDQPAACQGGADQSASETRGQDHAKKHGLAATTDQSGHGGYYDK